MIATHNGRQFLPGLLESLARFGTGGRKVLLLDTGSTCAESLQLLSAIAQQSWPFELEVSKTPYRGYDTGAYIHAFRNYEAETYLFLQDSVLIKNENWLEAFESRISHGVGCVPWLGFPMQWNSQEQIDWVMEKFETPDWPPLGVFGPMFMATRTALNDLESRGYLENIPNCKMEQMAMERAWAVAFTISGWGIRPVECAFSEPMLKNDMYKDLTKRFAWRA
ncbi:MAG TPA: hypothetical protein VGL56_19045 [Fimbriimonadaceae bacterium]